MINQRSYEIFGVPLYTSAENVVYEILQIITKLNKRIIKDPTNIHRWKALYEEEIKKVAGKFEKEWKKWADEDIPRAYLAGLKQTEKNIKYYGKSTNIINDIQNGSFMIQNIPPVPPIPPIPGQTLAWFEGWENHTQFMGVFRNAAYYSLEGQNLQILRKGDDIYRQTAIMAGEANYRETDIFTRRKLSQTMLNEYANKGIQTITYKNGAKYSIDTYCENIGRTMTGRAAIQASLNRCFESGYNLVVISSHFRACDMCIPYEGVTLSVERHPHYETIDEAITNGLFHNCCYDKETEVYTNDGWKLFKEVKREDKIFSLNPDNHIPEWIDWKNRFGYIEKDMIQFKSNSFDLLVTKNHKMYIGKNSHTKNNERYLKWEFEKAENCLNKNFRQLRCVNWKGNKNFKYDTFGYTKEQFAFLLGIFLAKGYIDKNRNGKIGRISICQMKKDCIKKIEKVLKPMGFYYSAKRFNKDNVKLAEYLKTFGRQSVRYIPDYMLNETPEIIRIFLDAFRIGDGTTRKNISKSNIASTCKLYFTSSKKLAEQIGECILKVGKYPAFTLNKTKGKLQKHKNGEYICNHDIWNIRENNSKMSYHNISPSIKHRGIQNRIVENYNDFVYCLELEKYHIMLVRRNGKIAWCGNCAHDISPFFEGLTKKELPRVHSGEQKLIDEYGYDDAQKMSYIAQQKQRYIERNIRRWKRRKETSLDESNKRIANTKILEWQKKQRDHLNENTFLRRKYEREQIKKAH